MSSSVNPAGPRQVAGCFSFSLNKPTDVWKRTDRCRLQRALCPPLPPLLLAPGLRAGLIPSLARSLSLSLARALTLPLSLCAISCVRVSACVWWWGCTLYIGSLSSVTGVQRVATVQQLPTTNRELDWQVSTHAPTHTQTLWYLRLSEDTHRHDAFPVAPYPNPGARLEMLGPQHKLSSSPKWAR